MIPPAVTFAVLTPPGAAAVATIAVAGPTVWDFVRQSFRPVGSGSLPSLPEYQDLWFGRFGPPPGDEIVLAVRRHGNMDCVELHCHGGPEVVRLLVDELRRFGAVSSAAGEFGLHQSADRLAELAAAELIRAPTLRTAGILLDQLHGAFAVALAELASALAVREHGAIEMIERLAAMTGVGRHLTRPWRVVVAGAPNVGKSSLVNAIAGFQRSVVTDVPGTTRDAVETPVAIDGWPVLLTDTAGRHTTADELEVQGIARGRSAATEADLCLWVVDASVPPVWPTDLPAKTQLVINKIDQPAVWDVGSRPDAIRVSATTEAGLADLVDRVGDLLVPEPPPAGGAVPFTDELADRIGLIRETILSGNSAAAGEMISVITCPVR